MHIKKTYIAIPIFILQFILTADISQFYEAVDPFGFQNVNTLNDYHQSSW